MTQIRGVDINTNMNQINIDVLIEAVKDSQTVNELRKKTNISLKRLKQLCLKNQISTEHFTPGVGRSTRSKKFTAEKQCAFCEKTFIVSTLKQFENQQTCSYSCSNKMFRRGSDHGNWKSYDDKSRKTDFYRRLCFEHHGKKCVVCEERLAVDVHHLDGDHQNNEVTNLIPLCANHHRYMHMKEGKELINDQIKAYLKTAP